MADPFIGEIKLVPYNFAPLGWALCQGQILSISQNTALFSLLGTMYGGNGQTTFALPDLRGRAIVHVGQGPGLSDYVQGEVAGQETVTLQAVNMPLHSHTVAVDTAAPSDVDPSLKYAATAGSGIGNAYGTAPTGTMPANSISNAGGGQPHENRQPHLTLNYIIATQGVFPQRN
jgi:microcystin-dependent protein